MMLYVGLLLLLLLISVPFFLKWRRTRHDYAALRLAVHQEQKDFAFLIDKDFRVKETNFYELNENIRDDQPYVLGNVVHCQNGCDAGLCGTGIACKECPIRLVITNAFKLHRDFSHITATMHLYDADHKVQEVDVDVSGHLVYVGDEPHFLVNVSR